jgi:SpoVK/Ycf46/Vps4 family AAA+-type ATPase
MKGELLKRLFRAIASDDSTAVQSMLAVVVEEERKKGHTQLAEQLANIYRKGDHRPEHFPQGALFPSPEDLSSNSVPPTIPSNSVPKAIDTHSLTVLSSKHRFNHPFIITIPRERLRYHMILSDVIEERFRRIEKEYAARDRLAHHGLRYRQKILLYGSPGCGKTMGAERLAWNTGLTLIKVRFDAMVSSYLGETATNLREVFESAAQSPCLLFLDECDAIAKSRNDTQEVGEIKRVVNTFLQLLDEYEVTNGLLVAATNLTKFLDEAVWRRFDDVIEVPKPTKSEIEGILKQNLSSVEVGTIDWRAIVTKMENFSAAQIVKAAQDAAKRAVLDREELVIQEHLEASIQEVTAFHA